MIEIWFGPGFDKSVQANCNALSEVGWTDRISYSLSDAVFPLVYVSEDSVGELTKGWDLLSSRRMWYLDTWTMTGVPSLL